MQFDQYSRLAIHLIFFFFFFAKNLKPNSKFEENFLLVCKTRWDKSIDVAIISNVEDKNKAQLLPRYSFIFWCSAKNLKTNSEFEKKKFIH